MFWGCDKSSIRNPVRKIPIIDGLRKDLFYSALLKWLIGMKIKIMKMKTELHTKSVPIRRVAAVMYWKLNGKGSVKICLLKAPALFLIKDYVFHSKRVNCWDLLASSYNFYGAALEWRNSWSLLNWKYLQHYSENSTISDQWYS